jgi:hypothetical protein
MKESVKQIRAMAFYHGDGFVPAWKQAINFVGKNGHIGTMLDVVNARLATGINGQPWNNYYTTMSAEYFGYSRGGNRILIVAHGIGPMSTLEGIQKAYSFEYKDKTRNNRGGRITNQQFWDLEDGQYGEVNVIDFDSIVDRYQYPFMGYLTVDEAIAEPLLHARLGSRAEEYLNYHARLAMAIHKDIHQTSLLDPYIIQMEDASNCPYTVGGFQNHARSYPFLDKGDGPIAHLLSTGRLSNIHHELERRVPFSIANDVGCHEWGNGVRLVAVCENSVITDIHPGFGDIGDLIKENWESLMEKIPSPPFPGGFYAVIAGKGETLFTQYPKKGARMDTHEPEFLIKAIKTVGKLMEFVTEIGGYYGFFKYDIKEVQALKPVEANAYAIIGDPAIISKDGNPTHHRADIQFYHAEVDTSRRLIRSEALQNDYDKLISLLEKKL